MNRRATLLSAAAVVVVAAVGGLVWRKLSSKHQIQARREEYERLIASIDRLSASGKVAQLGVGGFLRFWSDEVLLRLRRARFPLDEFQVDLVRKGSLLEPPARHNEIEALAQRLHIELPGSLQDLYGASNGCAQ